MKGNETICNKPRFHFARRSLAKISDSQMLMTTFQSLTCSKAAATYLGTDHLRLKEKKNHYITTGRHVIVLGGTERRNSILTYPQRL